MFKKKKTYVILAIIIIAIYGVYYAKTKKPVSVYTTANVEKGELRQTVSVSGKVVVQEEANLAFKASGRIDFLGVEVGDHVEAGQVVAKLDEGSLKLELRGALADIRMQEETFKAMQRKKETYNRDQRDAQKHQIEKSQASYDAIVDQAKDLTLKAPFSGTVIGKNIEANEMVSATAVLMTIAKDGDLEIEVNIPESDILKIMIGQKADVTLDALSSDEILEAEVTEIEPASTVIQDVVYYKAKLKITDKDERLKVGMSTDVDVKIFAKENVLSIPLRAIKEEGKDKFVEILLGENATEKKKITTGAEGDSGMIEVTSGLSGGEKVITSTSGK